MEHQISKKKNVMKHCNVCERDIHRSSFGNCLMTNVHWLKKGHKIKCDNCRLIGKTTEFENHLFSDSYLKIDQDVSNQNIVRNMQQK